MVDQEETNKNADAHLQTAVLLKEVTANCVCLKKGQQVKGHARQKFFMAKQVDGTALRISLSAVQLLEEDNSQQPVEASKTSVDSLPFTSGTFIGDEKNVVKYSCSLCCGSKEEFQTQAQFNEHYLKFHPHMKTPVISFPTNAPKTQTATVFFVCEYCGVSFQTQQARADHTRDKHKINGDSGLRKPDAYQAGTVSYTCQKCKEMFWHQDDLQVHELTKHFNEGKNTKKQFYLDSKCELILQVTYWQ